MALAIRRRSHVFLRAETIIFRVDEAVIYDRMLSDDEIAWLAGVTELSNKAFRVRPET